MIQPTLDSLKAAFIFTGGMAIGACLLYWSSKPTPPDRTSEFLKEWLDKDITSQSALDAYMYSCGFNFAARLANKPNMYMTVSVVTSNTWSCSIHYDKQSAHKTYRK